MLLVPEGKSGLRIVHELPRRIRIRNATFYDPDFDPLHPEAILRNLPGVTQVRFNLKTASVVIEYDGSIQTRKTILDLLDQGPFVDFKSTADPDDGPDPVGTAAKIALALLTPAMPRPIRSALGLALSLPTLLEGVETLLTKGIKVEVLDAAAVGFSLLRGDYLTSNSIVALLALGKYLEKLSAEKATGLLRKLLRPQVETAWVERDGCEVQIGIGEVIIGDYVVCGGGEMIPVDGLVIEGEADVNQSSITGESLPVHLKPDDDVMSGAFIEDGRLKIEARRVGSETSLARINRFLENSLRNKSTSQKESEKLADQLVPATFGLGLALFLLTRDVRRAAAVLTVDYSCAIKLANPVTVKTAMYTAAHQGVLLKGAQAMDALARADTIIFDKTGTLTRGVLDVTDIVPIGKTTPSELLAMAAAAEEHYSHPVARAVLLKAKEQKLTLPPTGQVDFIVAHGVSAYVNGARVLVGSQHFIDEDEGVDCSSAENYAAELRKQGKSLLFVVCDNVLEGVIALRDVLRPEAAGVLKELKELGVSKLVMLTGDHPDSARAVAGQLDALDEVHWDLKPEDKATIVKNYQEEGRMVAFAGDGVNDAPALVSAEVGICMPGGADLAREAAQVVLLKDDLTVLTAARKTACRCRDTIRNCFGATVGLNSLFLLMAGGGILTPAMAALLHNANTIGILGYAALSGLDTSGGIRLSPESDDDGL
jgi:heavy metal translocating P-type ATPase